MKDFLKIILNSHKIKWKKNSLIRTNLSKIKIYKNFNCEGKTKYVFSHHDDR
jgi:hypothetical protein